MLRIDPSNGLMSRTGRISRCIHGKRHRAKDGAVWLQAENQAFPDPDCRRTSLGGVGHHHAQHPHAVTVAGSIAFVDSNNCERVFQPELRASRSSCCRAVTRHALPIAVASP
jgi:hypothetical protein